MLIKPQNHYLSSTMQTLSATAQAVTPVAIRTAELTVALTTVLAKYSVILAHHTKLSALWLAAQTAQWAPVVMDHIANAMAASYGALSYLAGQAGSLAQALWLQLQAPKADPIDNPVVQAYLEKNVEALTDYLDEEGYELDDPDLKEAVLAFVGDDPIKDHIETHWDVLYQAACDYCAEDEQVDWVINHPNSFDLDAYIEENLAGILEDIDRLIIQNLGKPWTGQPAATTPTSSTKVDVGLFFSQGQKSYTVDTAQLPAASHVDVELCRELKASLDQQLSHGFTLSPLQSILYTIAQQGLQTSQTLEIHAPKTGTDVILPRMLTV